MNLTWFESVVYGLFAGFAEILPVSGHAHRVLMLKFFGVSKNMELLDLLVHGAVALALYLNCQNSLLRMRRAWRLARIPAKKRKRPLDLASLMDSSLLRTMLVPVILGLLLYRKTAEIEGNLILLSVFLILNGVILYVPQFFPGSNRDSRSLSRVEGLLMGLGGAVSVVPGISPMGAVTSIGSVCGVERTYALTMALLTDLFLTLGRMVYGILAVMDSGVGSLSAAIVLRYLLAAVMAFSGAMAGIRILRKLAADKGYALFAFYCFGLGLFIFVLNLIA